jgi:transcription-repair coupling factor (superfamily II helicase)
MIDTLEPPVAVQPLVDGPAPKGDGGSPGVRTPPAAVAARVMETWVAKGGDLLVLAASERRADEIGRALSAMVAPEEAAVLVFPPWDCLPYDRASPSRESMGRRMAVLARLSEPSGHGRLVVTSPEAAMQRTAPFEVVSARFDVAVGAPLDRDALSRFTARTGYLADERVDEPGEVGLLGEVVDVYPPAADWPCRIVISHDGSVAEIRRFDPVSQRSRDSAPVLSLTVASELVLNDAAEGAQDAPGDEHRMAEWYDAPLGSLFEALPKAVLLMEDDVAERAERTAEHVLEAFEARRTFGDPDDRQPPPPDHLYLSLREVSKALAKAKTIDVENVQATPDFARAGAPGTELKRYLLGQRAQGRKVIVAGLAHEQRVIARLLKRNRIETALPLSNWTALEEAERGALVFVIADLDRGYEDEKRDRVVVTATDIMGGRLAREARPATDPFGDTETRLGDVVIHEEYGLGVLRALEQIEADGALRDVLRLEYHGGATVLAPVDELDRIWRYSAEPSKVKLDRLNTLGWPKRRAEVSAQIDATAAQMVETAKAREAAEAAKIVPPRQAYLRFVDRFPFPESVDQLAAIEAVLNDLASGRPMNRLVCGDVGFGKTEVALRAAAAVALSGGQVMLAAPTTILARQHYETFRRRFEGAEFQVGLLSGMIEAPQAREVRDGLADGSIRVVIGTHALADETLAFADPVLVIIDEEHRFGAGIKAQLSSRASHLLSMSATPIPRTLQRALVGVQDVSIIASPPARRRPVRTFLADYDAASVRTALLREKRRGGQSFVVAPRIEDIEPLAIRLAELAPELHVLIAHGKRPPDEMEGVMSDFASGKGDILLATNIVENGLDVPRANTMLVWRPECFGLAQLHQLRGRVGRGRRQGFTYLLIEPETEIADHTRARLQTLEALDRLGAGFAISARDLDLRGGGDLVGEEQAGHIRLIGASLYQRILTQALGAARGETGIEPVRPRMTLSGVGRLPEDYIPDAAVRISLYARLSRLVSAEEIDQLHEEIEDRFGPLPEAATALMNANRLTILALAAGVTEVVSGPKATAFGFAAERSAGAAKLLPAAEGRRWSAQRLIIDTADGQPHEPAFLEAILAELAEGAPDAEAR